MKRRRKEKKSERDLSREAPYRRTKEERESVKFLAPWSRAYFAYPTFQSKRASTDFPDQLACLPRRSTPTGEEEEEKKIKREEEERRKRKEDLKRRS